VLHKWNFFHKISQNRTCSKLQNKISKFISFESLLFTLKIFLRKKLIYINFIINFQCESGLTAKDLFCYLYHTLHKQIKNRIVVKISVVASTLSLYTSIHTSNKDINRGTDTCCPNTTRTCFLKSNALVFRGFWTNFIKLSMNVYKWIGQLTMMWFKSDG